MINPNTANTISVAGNLLNPLASIIATNGAKINASKIDIARIINISTRR